MFKSVLIAEDHESISISIRKTVEEIGIPRTDYVYYCDDAFTRIQKALQSGEPYELLITDLYFDEDERKQQLTSGAALIKAVRQLQPTIKILVFSAEHKAAVIDPLFSENSIQAYVRKARHDAQELKFALEKIYQNRQYRPVHLRQQIQQKNSYEFTDFDVTIITLLSEGTLQKDIPNYLEAHQIKPSGLSSVEKRLNLIKEVLDFTKNEQLVAFCKDMGII